MLNLLYAIYCYHMFFPFWLAEMAEKVHALLPGSHVAEDLIASSDDESSYLEELECGYHGGV